ncbi:MAG: transcriptional regulator [Mediterranea sp.]|jgi:DNA-binding CsgD family transcriptional regulator|nr:transcriptional regulator [Mediterranea sp.]
MLALLIFLSCVGLPWGEAGARNSFIVNYAKRQTGAGAQTWSIRAYDADWTYFANQNGVLQYNGNQWRVFPLHNGQSVRSVLPSPKHRRVYVGGISEFGYLTPTGNGELTYVCMSDSIKGQERFLGNIWGIHEMDGVLYFQGDTYFLKYANGAYATIDVGCKIDCSDVVNGVLLAGTNEGVKVLIGNRFLPLNGTDYLNDKRIRGFMPSAEGTVVVTSIGLFVCDGHSCVRYPLGQGVEEFLTRNEVFCAATFGSYVALGTIRKGVVIVDTGSGEASYFDEDTGLLNNTVLSLSFDDKGNVWVGTDNGIDYICYRSPWSDLHPAMQSYGTGYDALPGARVLYLGTNRGLYTLPYPPGGNAAGELRLVPHSNGQVWSLARIGDHLFCFHDRGVFLIEGTTLRRVGSIGSAWTGQAVCGDRYPGIYFVGVYDGLCLLIRNGDRWESRRVEGISDSFRFFRQESDRVLWMTDLSRCYRVELDSALTQVVSRRRFDSRQGLPDGRVRIYKIDNEVCFSTEEGFYRYDAATDRMIPAPRLNTLLGIKRFYSDLTQEGGELIGLTDAGLAVATPGDSVARMILFSNPIPELVPDAEKVIRLDASTVVMPYYDGFATVAIHERQPASNKAMHILSVSTTYPQDSLLYEANFLGKKVTPRIAYRYNSIRLDFGLFVPADDERVTYRYRLNGSPWSDAGPTMSKEYSNLTEGQYQFEAQALFVDGRVSSDTFAFRVLPPWYRSGYAYLVYGLLFIIIFWILYRWDDCRVRRKKMQVAMEKDKEIERVELDNARKERQISRLKEEKLERDLQYKSQEMANLMINMTQKNEMLQEIKGDLHKLSAAVKAGNEKEVRQQLLIVSNKIDSNTSSEEMLRHIEEQFNIVHNDFMTHLQERHPSLSFNERMICAYLKMNLSTKDIAPLLNISVRGVETMRYRIRKKLGLEREDNLTGYLERLGNGEIGG